MTTDEFLERLSEALEADAPLKRGQVLAEQVTWDSLAVLSAVELFDEVGANVELQTVADAETTDDLIALAGAALTD